MFCCGLPTYRRRQQIAALAQDKSDVTAKLQLTNVRPCSQYTMAAPAHPSWHNIHQAKPIMAVMQSLRRGCSVGMMTGVVAGETRPIITTSVLQELQSPFQHVPPMGSVCQDRLASNSQRARYGQ